MTLAGDYLAPVASPAGLRTVNVVGLGYIGLPTACMMARAGLEVHGVDVSEPVVRSVNEGLLHIEESGLGELLASMVGQGALAADRAPRPADAFVVTVPTPYHPGESHAPDMSLVMAAARSLAPVLAPGNLVVLESTSPVGSTRALARVLAAERPDLAFPHESADPDVDVAYCPERIIPGNMLAELVHNDRVIGGMTERASERAADLYGRFVQGECILTDDKTAEMVKLTENSFRDVNIAFANELSMLSDRLGVDPWEVIRLANRHPRVSILSPGAGVGGHCIAVDPWFLVSSAPDVTPLIRTAREVNDTKPRWIEDKVAELADATPEGRIVCCGLTYKANVDDFRESPALDVTVRLRRRYGERVVACEPYAHQMPLSMAGLFELIEVTDVDPEDIVVVLVAHDEFWGLELTDDHRVVDAVGMLRTAGHVS